MPFLRVQYPRLNYIAHLEISILVSNKLFKYEITKTTGHAAPKLKHIANCNTISSYSTWMSGIPRLPTSVTNIDSRSVVFKPRDYIKLVR